MSGKFKSISSVSRGLALAALAVLLPSQSVQATSTATVAAATSNATVVTTISLSLTSPLSFGSVVEGDGPRVIASNAAPSFVGATRGAFSVGGATTMSYRVAAIGNITLSGPGTNMTISAIKGSCNGQVDALLAGGMTGCSLASSPDTLTIGGTLTIGATQTSGLYTGTYGVTVTYE